MLTYDSLRSDNDVLAFEHENGSPYKKGEDVLIDTLLLSRTNSIIKCATQEVSLRYGSMKILKFFTTLHWKVSFKKVPLES